MRSIAQSLLYQHERGCAELDPQQALDLLLLVPADLRSFGEHRIGLARPGMQRDPKEW